MSIALIFDNTFVDQTFKFNDFYKFKQYLEAVNNKKFGVEAEIHKNLTEKFEKSEKEILERIKEAVNKEFGVEAEIHKKLKKKFEKSKKETSVVLYDRIQQVYAGYFSDFYPNYYEKRHQDRSNLRVKIFEENNQYFIKIYGKSSISKQTETYLIENVELEDEFVHRLKFKKYDELYISFDLLSDNDTCSYFIKLYGKSSISKQTETYLIENVELEDKFVHGLKLKTNQEPLISFRLLSDNETCSMSLTLIFGNIIIDQTFKFNEFYKFKQYLEAVFNKKFGVEAEIHKNLKKKLEKSEKETSERIKKLEKEIEELKISMKNNKSTVNNVQINQFFSKTDNF
uniref:Uncharacterized protein n=1 Tax=Panagrolaimus sp. JU765 TaxID=591449 RepID=A0AC34QW26_9BILA